MRHNGDKCPKILESSINHTPAQDQGRGATIMASSPASPSLWREEEEAHSVYGACWRSHIREQSPGVKNHIFAKQLPASPLLYTTSDKIVSIQFGCFMFLSSSFFGNETVQRSPNYGCMITSEFVRLELCQSVYRHSLSCCDLSRRNDYNGL